MDAVDSVLSTTKDGCAGGSVLSTVRWMRWDSVLSLAFNVPKMDAGDSVLSTAFTAPKMVRWILSCPLQDGCGRFCPVHCKMDALWTLSCPAFIAPKMDVLGTLSSPLTSKRGRGRTAVPRRAFTSVSARVISNLPVHPWIELPFTLASPFPILASPLFDPRKPVSARTIPASPFRQIVEPKSPAAGGVVLTSQFRG
jgi:hypothetical protein